MPAGTGGPQTRSKGRRKGRRAGQLPEKERAWGARTNIEAHHLCVYGDRHADRQIAEDQGSLHVDISEQRRGADLLLLLRPNRVTIRVDASQPTASPPFPLPQHFQEHVHSSVSSLMLLRRPQLWALADPLASTTLHNFWQSFLGVLPFWVQVCAPALELGEPKPVTLRTQHCRLDCVERAARWAPLTMEGDVGRTTPWPCAIAVE
jgi:hypothetical protein